MEMMVKIYQAPGATKFISTHIWIWLLKSSRVKHFLETRYWACFFKSNLIQILHKSCVLWRNWHALWSCYLPILKNWDLFPTIILNEWFRVIITLLLKEKKRDMTTLGNTLSLYLNFMQDRPYLTYVSHHKEYVMWQ
jgi:hypothetical protein